MDVDTDSIDWSQQESGIVWNQVLRPQKVYKELAEIELFQKVQTAQQAEIDKFTPHTKKTS
jgi:hypothetical protein